MAWPAVIAAGAAAVGAGLQVYDYIQNADMRRIENEVMSESAAFNKDLLRRARGKFTNAELAQIQQAERTGITSDLWERLG